MNAARARSKVMGRKRLRLLLLLALTLILDGCRGGWMALSIALGIIAAGVFVLAILAVKDDEVGPPGCALILGVLCALGGGAYVAWPEPEPAPAPSLVRVPPSPLHIARRTLNDLRVKRAEHLVPTMDRWRSENTQINQQIASLRASLPRDITTYAQLLQHRDIYYQAVNLFERSATLTHGIQLLEERLAQYDRSIADLEQTIWQAEHMEALTRATDSPETVDRLRASIQTGQRLAQENLEPTTRADLGHLAEEAFNRMRTQSGG